MNEEQKNAAVELPLQEANKAVKELLVKQSLHKEIKENLKEC